jgi:tagatose 6-phosphate kinase
MILTVTPNVALDITYRVDQPTPGSSHRVRKVEERAGGKGINVARALHALGHDTVILGFVGGATAGTITTDLARGGLAHELVAVEGPTRRSIAVVDSSNEEATLFNEAGPRVPATSWNDLEATLAARLPEATALVVSGSLPPGTRTSFSTRRTSPTSQRPPQRSDGAARRPSWCRLEQLG